MSTSTRNLLARTALAALAAAVRLPGVTQGSMWLDEILETLQVRQGFWEAMRAVAEDRVHPPLEPMVAWVLVHAGLGEVGRRLAALTFGVATVWLLARWLERRFGPRVALIGGILAALSPILVATSTELRPYPLALLAFVWSLEAVERWRARSGGPAAEVVTSLATAALAHYLAGAVAIAVFVAGSWRAGTGSRDPADRRWVGLAGVALLPLLGWLGLLAAVPTAKNETWEAPHLWSLDALKQRFEELTTGALPDSAALLGASVWLIALLVGALAALRRCGGPPVLVGVLVGAVGVEIGLALAGHWSNARYDLFSVPFLIALAALGVDAVAERLSSRRALPAQLAVGLLTLPLLLAVLAGLRFEARPGRTDWRATAASVRALAPAGPVLVSNRWTRLSVGYYLGLFEPLPAVEVRSLDASVRRLETELADAGADCRTLILAGWPRAPELASALDGIRPRIRARGRDGARVWRLRLDAGRIVDCPDGRGATRR